MNDISEKSKEIGEKSVKIISHIFQNMTKILETLKNFDNLVNESKKRAKEAYSNEIDIRKNAEKMYAISKDIKKDLEMLFEEFRVMEIDENYFKKNIDNLNRVIFL